VAPSSEPPEETKPQVSQARNRLERPWTRRGDSLRESGQEAGRTNQEGNASARGSSLQKDGSDREEEDSKPSLVASVAAPISSDTAQAEVVQEEASTADAYLPPGWTLCKVEPDW
jgi:hypothetical protein